jgi:hypothetical protein
MEKSLVGLTHSEKKAINHLVDFWNAYLHLPETGNADEDKKAVCDAVNTIQAVMAFRVARRVDPDYWR